MNKNLIYLACASFLVTSCNMNFDWISPTEMQAILADRAVGKFRGFRCDRSEGRVDEPIQRVTKLQYSNIVRSFVNELVPGQANSILQSVSFADKIGNIPEDDHSLFKRMSNEIGLLHSNQWFDTAFDIGEAIALNHSGVAVGSCFNNNPSQNCLNNFYNRFDRLFAQPIQASDRTRFQRVYNFTNGDPREKLASVIALALSDVRTVARRRWGGEESGQTVRLTAHERADKLALTLTDDLPDEPLMAAARNGSLNQFSVYQSHVDRLLSNEQSQYSGFTQNFFDALLKMDRHEEPDYSFIENSVAFQNYISSNSSVNVTLDQRFENAYDMLHTYIDFVINRQQGNVASLLLSRQIFAQTPDLVEVTGQQWNGNYNNIPLTTQDNAGLLGQPAIHLLLAKTEDPRLIKRGALVATRLACVELDAPADTNAPNQEGLPFPLTYNQRLINTTEQPGTACIGCHKNIINPPGVALSHIDSLGRVIEQQQLVDPNSATTAPVLLPAASFSTEVTPRIGPTDRVTVVGAQGLSEHLAKGGFVDGCISRHLVTYINRRDFSEDHSDACFAQEVYDALKGENGSFLGAYRALLTSSYFLSAHKAGRTQ